MEHRLKNHQKGFSLICSSYVSVALASQHEQASRAHHTYVCLKTNGWVGGMDTTAALTVVREKNDLLLVCMYVMGCVCIK